MDMDVRGGIASSTFRDRRLFPFITFRYFCALILVGVFCCCLLWGSFSNSFSVQNTRVEGKFERERVIKAVHTQNDGFGDDGWLQRCKHHLCTPHQQPAWYYTCNVQHRKWSLTFLAGGHWPSNEGPREQQTEPVGHIGWSGSILRGLSALNLETGSWNYNPSHINMLNDVIWTDNCVTAHAAMRSDEANRAKFVVCGAVGVTFEDKSDLSPEVGFFIVPSPWVADRFRRQRVPIRVLVSGVDQKFFKPSVIGKNGSTSYKVKPGKNIVLYLKQPINHAHPMVESVTTTLDSHGWQVSVILYGEYSLELWKDALDRSVAAVFMTGTESQSIALAEAWAFDIPTFVYEVSPLHPLFVFGRWWPHSNEGPYINYMNGARWSTVDGLLNLLNDMPSHPWAPREYVLNTMTDEISVLNVLRAIQCEWNERIPKLL
jgi:hypothetical protein